LGEGARGDKGYTMGKQSERAVGTLQKKEKVEGRFIGNRQADSKQSQVKEGRGETWVWVEYRGHTTDKQEGIWRGGWKLREGRAFVHCSAA